MENHPPSSSEKPDQPALQEARLPKEITLGGTTFVTGKLLGEGANGRVFVIRHEGSGTVAACKESKIPSDPRLAEAAIAMFAREAAVLATLQHLCHPALPNFLHADLDRRPPAIVFEYIDGQTLEDKVNQHGPLTEAEIMILIRTVGGGLAAMHNLSPELARSIGQQLGETEPINSFVYLDPKPSNILATNDPARPFRLVDYGTTQSTHFGPGQTLEARRSSAAAFGTPPYADPNYVWYKELLPATDVYSFAATILDLSLPGGIPDEVTKQVTSYLLNHELYDPRQPWPLVELVEQTPLSPPLKEVLQASLSVKLADRPHDMRQFLQRLAVVYEPEYQIDADGTVSFEKRIWDTTSSQALTAYSALISVRDPGRLEPLASSDDYSRQLEMLAEVTQSEVTRADFSRIMATVLGAINPISNSEIHPVITSVKSQSCLFVRPVDLITALTSQKNPRQLAEALDLRAISGSMEFWEPLTNALNSYDLQPFIQVEQTITTNRGALEVSDDPDIVRALQAENSQFKKRRADELVIYEHQSDSEAVHDLYPLTIEQIAVIEDADEREYHRIMFETALSDRLRKFMLEPIEFTYLKSMRNPDAPIVGHSRGEALFAAAPVFDPITRPFFVRAANKHSSLLTSPVVLNWLVDDIYQTRTGEIPAEQRRPRYLESISLVRQALETITDYCDWRTNYRELAFKPTEITELMRPLRQLIPATIVMDREFATLAGDHPEFERYFLKAMMRTWANPLYVKSGTVFHIFTQEIMTILVEDEQLKGREDLIAPYALTRCRLLKEEIAAIKLSDHVAIQSLLHELYLFALANLSRETRRTVRENLESFTTFCETLQEVGNPATANLIRQYINAIISP